MSLDKFIANRKDFIFPICNKCKHKYTGNRCKAFAVIPTNILEGGKHDRILPAQKVNLIFEAKS